MYWVHYYKVLLYAEEKDLCNIRWLMERTTFLASFKICLLTKIYSSKKSREQNFRRKIEEIVQVGFIKHEMAWMQAGTLSVIMLNSHSNMTYMFDLQCCPIQTFLLLIHHITEQNTATVLCCHDLFICFVTLDFKQYKSSCWHLLHTQTANIQNVCAYLCHVKR